MYLKDGCNKRYGVGYWSIVIGSWSHVYAAFCMWPGGEIRPRQGNVKTLLPSLLEFRPAHVCTHM